MHRKKRRAPHGAEIVENFLLALMTRQALCSTVAMRYRQCRTALTCGRPVDEDADSDSDDDDDYGYYAVVDDDDDDGGGDVFRRRGDGQSRAVARAVGRTRVGAGRNGAVGAGEDGRRQSIAVARRRFRRKITNSALSVFGGCSSSSSSSSEDDSSSHHPHHRPYSSYHHRSGQLRCMILAFSRCCMIFPFCFNLLMRFLLFYFLKCISLPMKMFVLQKKAILCRISSSQFILSPSYLKREIGAEKFTSLKTNNSIKTFSTIIYIPRCSALLVKEGLQQRSIFEHTRYSYEEEIIHPAS
jgi:hypothetical protein